MKPWKYLTDTEKGALLLAHHERKVIQFFSQTYSQWLDCTSAGSPAWAGDDTYRVKPVVKEVVMFTKIPSSCWGWTADGYGVGRTHKITFNTIGGEPDCSSIIMEKLK